MSRPVGMVWTTLLCGLTVACNAPPVGSGCRADIECSASETCWVGKCAAREGPRTLHLVAYPAPEVAAAPTEWTNVVFAPSPPTTVTMAANVNVAGHVVSPSNAPFALLAQGDLGVTARWPSAIPGAPDIQLNSVASVRGAGVADFVLAVPQGSLGGPALVAVSPRAPVDAVAPPLSQAVRLLNDFTVSVPGADDLQVIEGEVRTEFDQPAAGYVAAVLRAGVLVSTTSLLTVDGTFRVGFPRSQEVQNDDASLVVGLPGQPSVPKLVMKLASTAADVGPFRFPAHPTAQTFRVPVVGVDAKGVYTPVVGALLRFETQLPSNAEGVSARYVQELQSGTDGTVDVPLVAGGLEQARAYTVEVTSPSFSEASSRCLANFAVGPAAAGAQSIPTTAVIELPRRPALVGTIKRSDQTALRGAVVTAVRLGPVAGATDCAALNRLGNATTSSDAEGSFRLRVDAGTFRIEVRPPTGEPVAYTTLDVVVTTEGLVVDLVLPVGRVTEGKLLAPAGTPCAACRVVIYEGTMPGPATLRNETVSDPDGLFRFVLPAQ